MVIYSRWRPDGGYDYFETDKFFALGNDLPDPVVPNPTQLGVPSVEVGHRIPAFARRVGEGDLPIGIVAPMDTSNLAGVMTEGNGPLLYFVLGAGFVGLVWAGYSFVRRSE